MDFKLQMCHSDVGIATGNWGCGAFGGDPQVKTVIQWLAASQVTFTSSAAVLKLVFSRLLKRQSVFGAIHLEKGSSQLLMNYP